LITEVNHLVKPRSALRDPEVISKVEAMLATM
jgi:hypothetical protein